MNQNYTVQVCVNCADVNVSIGGDAMGSYTLGAVDQGTYNYPGIFNGPLQVQSTNGNAIFATERTTYGNSFHETTGIPGDQLTTDYWFPWYDFSIMKTWISVGNPSASQTANVSVYIAGQFKGSSAIAPQGRWTPNYPGVFRTSMKPMAFQPTAWQQSIGSPGMTSPFCRPGSVSAIPAPHRQPM